MKLIKTTIDRLQGDGRDRVEWDDALTGFGVRVTPAGTKLYLCQYRANGRPRRISLGRVGVLTPDQARRKARELLGLAAGGGDPWRERREHREASTFRELVERYLEVHHPKLKPSTRYVERRLLEAKLLPVLGARRLDEITRRDLETLHRRHAAIPYQANRCVQLVKALYNHAERWELFDGRNPARNIKPYRELHRERFLSPAEYERLGTALASAEAEHPEWAGACAVLRLLALSGCRRGEVLTLQWADVDEGRACLRLRDAKAGPRAVFLDRAALDVLARLPRASAWVFPSNRRRGAHLTPAGLKHVWCEVRQRAELEGVRLHDLRHSHASTAAATGYSLPIIGALLGHREQATTQRYAHLADDPVREASARVQGRIGAALAGRPDADVVELGRRR